MSTTILRQVAKASRVRAFSSTAAARKDLVQDLYLQQLRAFKPAPVAKDAHVGVVKSYSLPPTPKAPSLPTDIASELSAYDASEPTLAEAEAVAVTTESHGPDGAEAFLEMLEADLPKPDAHHH